MYFPIKTNRSPKKHPELFGNKEPACEVSENEEV
jgi:hypothetical protein